MSFRDPLAQLVAQHSAYAPPFDPDRDLVDEDKRKLTGNDMLAYIATNERAWSHVQRPDWLMATAFYAGVSEKRILEAVKASAEKAGVSPEGKDLDVIDLAVRTITEAEFVKTKIQDSYDREKSLESARRQIAEVVRKEIPWAAMVNARKSPLSTRLKRKVQSALRRLGRR